MDGLADFYLEAISDPGADPGPELEEHLLQLAEGLPESGWRTGRYLRLEAGESPARLEAELRALWEGYAATPVPAEQATLESVLFHRLLRRGFEGWYRALEQARRGDREDALALAEESNRLLVAVAEAQEFLMSLTGSAGVSLGEGDLA